LIDRMVAFSLFSSSSIFLLLLLPDRKLQQGVKQIFSPSKANRLSRSFLGRKQISFGNALPVEIKTKKKRNSLWTRSVPPFPLFSLSRSNHHHLLSLTLLRSPLPSLQKRHFARNITMIPYPIEPTTCWTRPAQKKKQSYFLPSSKRLPPASSPSEDFEEFVHVRMFFLSLSLLCLPFLSSYTADSMFFPRFLSLLSFRSSSGVRSVPFLRSHHSKPSRSHFSSQTPRSQGLPVSSTRSGSGLRGTSSAGKEGRCEERESPEVCGGSERAGGEVEEGGEGACF